MCDMPSAASKKSAEKREAEWKAESDHRTLTDAEEIRADAGRMNGVVAHHRKKARALQRVGARLSAGRRSAGSRRA